MILLQLSAAQGSAECCLAVSKAMKVLAKEAEEKGILLTLIEQEEGVAKDTYKSVLYRLQGDFSKVLAESWSGTLQWICQSPFRSGHKRKNWFFMGTSFECKEETISRDIKFESFRSSGPGGQHVNKTSSAVRATHLDTGISVKVQSERSQHLNKRLAVALIELKLVEHKQQQQQKDKNYRHKLHHSIERGNPVRIFEGLNFV